MKKEISFYKKLKPSSHFVKRCKERGIEKSDIQELFSGIVWAVNENKEDYCDIVAPAKENGYWYRVRTLDGIYYAPCVLSDIQDIYVPKTIFDQETWSCFRKRIKSRK